jgi:hypothetical protein
VVFAWPVRLVVVVGLVIAIVIPSTKFVPLIVTDRLASTPYVTDAGLSDPIVGGTASAGLDQNSPTAVTAQPRRTRKPALLSGESVEKMAILRWTLSRCCKQPPEISAEGARNGRRTSPVE